MIRTVVGTALVAAATAQSDIFAQRHEINVFDLSSQMQASMDSLAVVSARNAGRARALEAQLLTSTDQDSPLAVGLAAINKDLVDRTQGLLTSAETNAQRLSTLTAVVEANRVAGADAIEDLTSDTNRVVSTMTSNIDHRINAVLDSVASTVVVIEADASTTAATLAASVTAQIRSVNVSMSAMTATLAGKKDAVLHFWTGDCSNHYDSGWYEYCLDRADINTAAPYFRKQTNTRFLTLQAGYYTSFFYRMYQTCNWEHSLLYFDGQHRRHSHGWGGWNSHWRDATVMITWPLAASKQFWTRTWSSCWSTWNNSKDYTRYTGTYAGKIPA